MDGILNTAYLISQSNTLSIVHMACNQLTYYLLIFKKVDEMIAYVFDMAKRTTSSTTTQNNKEEGYEIKRP